MATTREDTTSTIVTTPFAGASVTTAGSTRTPWWRRLTALISLGSLVVIAGMLLAAFTATAALLLLTFLERAAN